MQDVDPVRDAHVSRHAAWFHNNSTPRYPEASAKLAWERTIAFFKEYLG